MTMDGTCEGGGGHGTQAYVLGMYRDMCCGEALFSETEHKQVE